MALSVHSFDIALSDVDRGVYEALSLRVARHPSESAEYLVARLLAYALEHQEGIGFTQGLSDADAPAVEVVDPTGQRTGWIDVGTPSPERLHRATKAADRVAVYCHKDPTPWIKAVGSAKIYARESGCTSSRFTDPWWPPWPMRWNGGWRGRFRAPKASCLSMWAGLRTADHWPRCRAPSTPDGSRSFGTRVSRSFPSGFPILLAFAHFSRCERRFLPLYAP